MYLISPLLLDIEGITYIYLMLQITRMKSCVDNSLSMSMAIFHKLGVYKKNCWVRALQNFQVLNINR